MTPDPAADRRPRPPAEPSSAATGHAALSLANGAEDSITAPQPTCWEMTYPVTSLEASQSRAETGGKCRPSDVKNVEIGTDVGIIMTQYGIVLFSDDMCEPKVSLCCISIIALN